MQCILKGVHVEAHGITRADVEGFLIEELSLSAGGRGFVWDRQVSQKELFGRQHGLAAAFIRQ